MHFRRLLLAGLALACRGSVRPPDIDVASVPRPTRAAMRVVATKRPLMPWAQVLMVTVRDQVVSSNCPGDVPLPRAPFPDAMIEDAAGDRVAYRCAVGAPWGVVYVSPSRAWPRCEPPMVGPTVDWSRLPDFVAAAPRLATCPGAPLDALVADVRLRGGETGVANLVDGTVDGGGESDAWEAAYRGLAPDTQRRVRAHAEGNLARVERPYDVDVDRAARVADLAGAHLEPERLVALLRFCEPGPGRPGCDRLLRRLIREAPDDAMQVACDKVNSRTLSVVEAAALASSDARCEAFRERYTSTRCAEVRDDAARCEADAGARPCTRDDYLAAVERELSGDRVVSGSYEAYTRHRARVLAAAALRQGIDCAALADGGP